MAEFIAGRGTQALSIIGTVLGGLATLGEGMGVINGSGTSNSGVAYATKDDLDNAILLANKDSEIALLKANSESESKMIDVYEKVMTRVNSDKDYQTNWNTQQLVNNATMAASIATNANSISALQAMTKTVIPNSSVCPGWGTATVSVSTTGTTTTT